MVAARRVFGKDGRKFVACPERYRRCLRGHAQCVGVDRSCIMSGSCIVSRASSVTVSHISQSCMKLPSVGTPRRLFALCSIERVVAPPWSEPAKTISYNRRMPCFDTTKCIWCPPMSSWCKCSQFFSIPTSCAMNPGVRKISLRGYTKSPPRSRMFDVTVKSYRFD